MKIQRSETGEKGRFYIEENERQIALMTYRKSGEGEITIDHTEVDSNFRGEGFGEDLVREAASFARANDLQIAATCPFAKKILSAGNEFRDVFEE